MSFEPETEVVELESRLGRVGSIQAWNPWKSRRSMDDAKWWVSKIARLSHGLGEVEDYAAHFDRVVNQLHHESVLEFVPTGSLSGKSLPELSYRHRKYVTFNDFRVEDGDKHNPASAFLVECPIIVRAQWMRHRAETYMEMSRRSVKDSKIPFTFYGVGADPLLDALFEQAIVVYNHLLDIGWAPEAARIAIPQGAMTKFWVAGFDRDWMAFLALRNDPHAQAEIRVFAQWIESYLAGKNSDAK